jgi:hypothetical protein
MPAIIREILRRRPDAASATTAADAEQLPLHCACICAHDASLQALEIVEQLLQAYPAGISVIAQGALPIETAVALGRMWSSCSACWQLARHRQWTLRHLMASTRCIISPIVRLVGHRAYRGAARCQQGLDRAQAVMGVSHCMVHAQRSARSHSSLRCLVSGGSARDDADGWLPIHYLRILREPDEEVTPEDIVTIKLLVAAWPVGQHSSPRCR